MSRSYIIVPAVIYGVGWAICANHPYWGFMWLLIAGVIAGIALGFESFIKNMLIAFGVYAVMNLIALIPGIGELVDGIVLLVVTILKLRTIFRNFWLILIGFGCYFVLFYFPHSIHHSISGGSPDLGYRIVDATIGGSIMAFLFYLLESMGYDGKRIYLFTIGLPGVLFLINYGKGVLMKLGE